MDPGDFPWAIRSATANPDFLVSKENCAAAVDRSRGADARRILARRSLFRSLNRAMETSVKMKFLLDATGLKFRLDFRIQPDFRHSQRKGFSDSLDVVYSAKGSDQPFKPGIHPIAFRGKEPTR